MASYAYGTRHGLEPREAAWLAHTLVRLCPYAQLSTGAEPAIRYVDRNLPQLPITEVLTTLDFSLWLFMYSISMTCEIMCEAERYVQSGSPQTPSLR
jgi:hypothetical protein